MMIFYGIMAVCWAILLLIFIFEKEQPPRMSVGCAYLITIIFFIEKALIFGGVL